MADPEIDLLQIDRGLVVAPAGCGKTQLIADALKRHTASKPVLVLTHTNAGVVALRNRLDKAGVKASAYRLSTIDGWAIRLITTFPLRSGHDEAILNGPRPSYPKIRVAAFELLKKGHIADVVRASYSRLLVDEYQDCSIRQHAIVYYASFLLPSCVVGDDMQAIFGFGDDNLADWEKHVCSHFAAAGTLATPWRWINAGSDALGHWLLQARAQLQAGLPIDLAAAPPQVRWIELDGAANHAKLLEACKVPAPNQGGSVLIIGESTSPPSQRRFASQTPGAVTVEAVDLRDLVSFAGNLDLTAANALSVIASFAEELMTNVGATELVRRVNSLRAGTARKDATEIETAALRLLNDRTYGRVAELLVEINKAAGVRNYRPEVLRACLGALGKCQLQGGPSFREAAIQMREQNRLLGRPLPRRAVGSTLLLKGLEADVCVILDAEGLSRKNLYVAMTRGSRQLLVCSRKSVLSPSG